MSQKELFNEIELEIFEETKKHFELQYLTVGKVHFGGEVIVCVVKFKDQASFRNHWKEFNSFLTAKFSPIIKDDYSKWNYYVFYVYENTVEKSLKYEIENNKFSSRKIVVENCKLITVEIINNIISEHITNDNIKIDVEQKQISTFKKNAYFAKIIDKLSVNKRNDEDMQDALNQIENIYKDEI